MAAYTEKCTESESDIQSNDLLYKTHQQHQNTFEMLENFVKSKNIYYFVISISSIIRILDFL